MNEKTILMMVTYNRVELTKQTIDSLYSTVYRDFDLVIVIYAFIVVINVRFAL